MQPPRKEDTQWGRDGPNVRNIAKGITDDNDNNIQKIHELFDFFEQTNVFDAFEDGNMNWDRITNALHNVSATPNDVTAFAMGYITATMVIRER